MASEDSSGQNPNMLLGDGQALWINGQRSDVDPIALDDQSYPRSTNLWALDGILHTRPRMRAHARFPVGWPQGMGVFEDITGKNFMLVAINGGIYLSRRYPFEAWERIPGIQMAYTARQIWMEAAVVNARTQQDGGLTILDPYVVIVISDATTRTTVYNTKTELAEVQNPGPPVYGIPLCGQTKWVDDRLYCMRKNKIIPSNLAEPDKFTEGLFIAGGGYIPLPRRGTALGIPFSQKGLLAFTSKETISIQTFIRDRDQWQLTPRFTETIFPKIGCVASKSFVSHFGLSAWYMGGGMITLDDAFQTYRTSKMTLFDRPMAGNTKRMSPDVTQVCGGSHERWLLASVPASSPFNRETWLYDDNNTSVSGWTGAWRGINPVEWATGVFNGDKRTFCLSIDDPADPVAGCTVWEVFPQMQTLCSPSFETEPPAQLQVGLFGGAQKPTLKERTFAYAKIELVDMVGPVNVKAWMAPATTAVWRKVMDKSWNIGTPIDLSRAEIVGDDEGCILPNDPYNGCRMETRVTRTQDYQLETDTVNEDDNEKQFGSIGDRGYQMLIEFTGRVGVRSVRVFTNNGSEDQNGEPDFNKCEPTCISELGAKLVDCEYIARPAVEPDPAIDPDIITNGPPKALLWEEGLGFLLYVGDSGVTDPAQYLTYVDDEPADEES